MINYNRLLWIVISAILMLWLFNQLSPILTPFIIASILAYLVDPLVAKLEKLKLPRFLAVAVVFISMLLLILLLLLLLIPLLQAQFIVFVSHLPQMISWVQLTLLPWLGQYVNVQQILNIDGFKNVVTEHLQQAGNILSVLWLTISKSSYGIVIFIIDLFLVPVVTFYLLRDWPNILTHTRRLFPRSLEALIVKLFIECNEVLGAFFRGQLMVMFFLGIYYAVALWIVGLQLALLIGILIGLISIVPYVGFIVGSLIALISCVVQFHDWRHVIMVAIVFAIGQALEGMLLTPLLVGDKIGLHPVAVIFAIMAGGHLFGFFGVLLALPVAAVIMVVIRHLQQQYFVSKLYTHG